MNLEGLQGLSHRVLTPLPLPLRLGTAGKNHLNDEIASAKPYKFRTFSALVPLRTPHISESAELTQGAL